MRHGESSARRGALVVLVVFWLSLLGTASSVWAQSPYQATFTLGIGGRSGCLVCHSDQNMARLTAGRNISYYINEEVLNSSVHKDISCLACHTDFTYGTPHRAKSNWKKVASEACKNCHKNAYQRYISSAHGSRAPEAKRPTCGGCHGSHAIGSQLATQTAASLLYGQSSAATAFHLSGQKMCGRCHQAATDSYSDYYHGAAYKNGAPDAPACWDCHGSHKIYGVRSKNPSVAEMDLVEACGQCHAGVTKDFLSYTPMIHGSERIRSENLLWRSVRPVTDWLAGTKELLMSVARSLFP